MRRALTVVALMVGTSALAAPAQAAEQPAQPGAPAGASQLQRMGVTDTQRRQRVAFWSTVRKIAKCALGIAVFVGSNVVAVSKLRRSGGVWKVAKRTWQAKGKIRKVAVLTSVFGEVLGLNQVAEGCGA